MSTFAVTRHPGAVEWLQDNGFEEAQHVPHFNPETLEPGDVVVGTLPVHLVAEVTRRGGRYLHLQMDLPPEMRGCELTAADMNSANATLVEFRAEKV